MKTTSNNRPLPDAEESVVLAQPPTRAAEPSAIEVNTNTRVSPGRRTVGEPAPGFSAPSLQHGTVVVPAKELVHLQFRRFAGCPICSLHLRSFARRHAELEAASVRTIAVFHSSLEALRRYHADLPFAVLGDEHKVLYRLYGVESSMWGMLHPRAIGAALWGMVSVANNPLDNAGGVSGKPADFLIDPEGQLCHVKYGAHPQDHLEVDEVLALAASRGPSVPASRR